MASHFIFWFNHPSRTLYNSHVNIMAHPHAPDGIHTRQPQCLLGICQCVQASVYTKIMQKVTPIASFQLIRFTSTLSSSKQYISGTISVYGVAISHNFQQTRSPLRPIVARCSTHKKFTFRFWISYRLFYRSDYNKQKHMPHCFFNMQRVSVFTFT